MTTTHSDRAVQPYLFFEGRCEEALELYRKILDAKVTALVRIKDVPGSGSRSPGADDKILHCGFRIGESTVLASDGSCQGEPTFRGFSLSLTVADEGEADRLFAALADGGQVQVPLTATPFSTRFGMVADRLGVSWMISVAARGETA
jgi:PhnB protein